MRWRLAGISTSHQSPQARNVSGTRKFVFILSAFQFHHIENATFEVVKMADEIRKLWLSRSDQRGPVCVTYYPYDTASNQHERRNLEGCRVIRDQMRCCVAAIGKIKFDD